MVHVSRYIPSSTRRSTSRTWIRIRIGCNGARVDRLAMQSQRRQQPAVSRGARARGGNVRLEARICLNATMIAREETKTNYTPARLFRPTRASSPPTLPTSRGKLPENAVGVHQDNTTRHSVRSQSKLSLTIMTPEPTARRHQERHTRSSGCASREAQHPKYRPTHSRAACIMETAGSVVGNGSGSSRRRPRHVIDEYQRTRQ